MYQDFPQVKKYTSFFSTLLRLFSRLILPCIVLLITLLVYPAEEQWSDTNPLTNLSFHLGTWDHPFTDAVLSNSSPADFYEVYQAGEFSQSAFQALEETILKAEFSDNTLKLHYHFVNPEAYGLSANAVSLGHYSADYFTEQAKEAEIFLDRLLEIPRESLTSEQQLSYDILEWKLTQSSQAGTYAAFANPFSSGAGILSELPVLLAEYTFHSEADVEAYLALLADFPRYFAELLSFAEQSCSNGLTISAPELSKCIAACSAFCENYAADPDSHFLNISFETAIKNLDFLTPAQILDYTAKNRSLLEESVIPSYGQIIKGLENLLAESDSTEDYFHTAAGLCTMPGGAEYYRYLIASRVGTSRSAEDLIELITSRMVSDIRAMDELYLTYPEIGEEIITAPRLDDPQLILIDLQSKMRNEFPVLSGVSCRIQWIPDALEDTMNPAFYLVPPIDAPDKGSIFLNSSRLNASNLYLTLAHEGYPGHLYQTVYFSSVTEDPLRSLISLPGFSEGWATYAERQAYYYIDGYSEAAAEFLCRNASASLALYALCDLNIHLNGWTPSDMSHFLQVWVSDLTEEMVTELYNAIIADPANYLSYHVGAMEFELLREEAEERLGDTFDLKDFHAFLLQTGPCPFDILRVQFEAWIKNAATA